MDLRSDGLHPENDSHVALDAQKDFLRLVTTRREQKNHCEENSVESHHSDDESGYDSPPLAFEAQTKVRENV